MGVDFTVYKGSQDGRIVKSSGHREVGRTQALVRLTHSGVCGTDEHYKHVDMGLGHEGVGVITELGAEAARISDLKVGDRVGMGWVQKICGYCKPCLTGGLKSKFPRPDFLGLLIDGELTELDRAGFTL